MRTLLAALCGLIVFGSLASAEDAKPATADAAKPVSYYRQVRPLLQRHCSGCHQPAKDGGKLVLTSVESFQKGGENGAGFVAGKPDDSLILDYIVGDPPEMPRGADPLTAAQVAVIKDWIVQGAKDDTPATARETISAEHPPVYSSPPVITALAFSPDSQLLAVSGHHEVLLHKADGSERVARLVGRSPKINSVRFSPDGKLLAAVGGAPALFGEVQLWNVADKTLTQSLAITFDTLFGASFSDDGKQLAFGAFDNRARVMDVESGKVVMTLETHSDLVFATTFSLKLDHLITVSRDMAMKLTEIKTGQFIDNITSITPGALKGGLMAVQRHPKEEQVLAGGADGEPKLYKIFRTQARQIGDDFNKLKAYPALPGRIFSLEFNADGSMFVAGSSNATSGAARLYNTNDAKTVHDLAGHTAGVFAVAFRPDGKQVATGGFDGKVRLFDVESGMLVKEFVPVELTPAVATK
ncbi:MAG TPA: c-type cytochrome domain-containing protein [Planctomycetaceae bacterium]|nr:c-type cytochrome domain-containing protein [Planctomycetaceae bacterium]